MNQVPAITFCCAHEKNIKDEFGNYILECHKQELMHDKYQDVIESWGNLLINYYKYENANPPIGLLITHDDASCSLEFFKIKGSFNETYEDSGYKLLDYKWFTEEELKEFKFKYQVWKPIIKNWMKNF